MELDLNIAGIGIWGPGLAGWAAASPVLRGEVGTATDAATRPAPALLPPAERRRAPESVLIAVQAATEACAMAGVDPATLPAVFASAQGDVAITDYLCAVLATAPHELSPTKFHNSVHNAAVGYWTIAARCHEPSTALTAAADSAGAGLLEAAVQALDRGSPVLLAVHDCAARGPLAGIVAQTASLAVALVLAPAAAGLHGPRLRIRPAPAPLAAPPLPATLDALCPANPAAAALPLLAALAGARPARLTLPAAPGCLLELVLDA